MSRQVLHGKEIRAELLIGVNILADSVKVTLGPGGRCVILEKHPMFPPIVTKDGVTVAKEVRDLPNPYQNAGAQLVREAASKTSDEAGDGTTTATVLAQVIFQQGLKHLENGADPVALKRGIDKAVTVVVDHIKAIAQPVTDDETIVRVGTISSNGDREIGELIAAAMKAVGQDGIITSIDSSDSETTLKVVEGMQIDRGFVAHPFITDPDRLEAVLREPYILLTERKLQTMTPELDTVLGLVAQTGKPVLIVAGDYDGPFIVSLIHNIQQGVLRSVAVKAPAFGDLRRTTLEDMAIVTGAYAFTEDCGRKLDSITIDDLGRAEQVTSGQHHTVITGGQGDSEKKASRVSLLRSLIDATENDLERENLKRRLARLAAGVAMIRVGAPTEGEQKEKKDRVEDAICATKAATEEGIVPGGGKALLSAAPAIRHLWRTMGDTDERCGVEIISDALISPFLQITSNAGMDIRWARNTAAKLSLPGIDSNHGYNAATDTVEDLISAGVIDPAKVTRTALQKAASVAATLLTAACMVADKQESKDGVPPAPRKHKQFSPATLEFWLITVIVMLLSIVASNLLEGHLIWR